MLQQTRSARLRNAQIRQPRDCFSQRSAVKSSEAILQPRDSQERSRPKNSWTPKFKASLKVK